MYSSGEISNTYLSSHFYAFWHCDTLAFSLVYCSGIYTRSLKFNRLHCKPFSSSEIRAEMYWNTLKCFIKPRKPKNSRQLWGHCFQRWTGFSDSFCIVQEKAWNPEPGGMVCLPFKQSLLRSIGAGRSDWEMTRPDNNNKKNETSHSDAGTFQSPLRSNTSTSFPLPSLRCVRGRQSSSTWHLPVWARSGLREAVTIILDCEDAPKSIPVLFLPSFLGLPAWVSVHTTGQPGSPRASVKQH